MSRRRHRSAAPVRRSPGPGASVAIDFVAWGAVQAGAGYLTHRLPDRLFAADRWLWRERRLEDGGRLYVRRLGIRRWKHWLPDAGAVFAGGMAKRHLGERSPAHLARFALETRRTELNHWMALALAPAFALWNPPPAMPVIVFYALASNLPCIAAQRYNRIRLVRVLRSARSG
ncbi:MAG: hypothetical protein ACRD0L_16135 [Acidimicrobiales bacterium]